MNTQATNGALKARQEVIKEAKRMRLDAYMTGETVRVCNEQGRWVPVRTLLEVKQLKQAKRKAKRKASLKKVAQWLTRSTPHPFAY